MSVALYSCTVEVRLQVAKKEEGMKMRVAMAVVVAGTTLVGLDSAFAGGQKQERKQERKQDCEQTCTQEQQQTRAQKRLERQQRRQERKQERKQEQVQQVEAE